MAAYTNLIKKKREVFQTLISIVQLKNTVSKSNYIKYKVRETQDYPAKSKSTINAIETRLAEMNTAVIHILPPQTELPTAKCSLIISICKAKRLDYDISLTAP